MKFQYNLGTNPINIINWAVRVYPGDWYTVYATRSVPEKTVDISRRHYRFPRARNDVRETSAEIPQPRFQGPLLLVPAEREGERQPGNEVENSILMTPY